MSFQYSQKLRDEIIKCFKEEHDYDIESNEQADEFLDSLAGLFEAFAKPAEKKD